ncbi:MAG: hypothetical protein ACR2IV_16985 [Bryobacteraceae bacterium]
MHLIRIAEPRLQFDFDQYLEDPRDGLTLFGPLQRGRPYGIRVGAIGTRSGLSLLCKWIKRIEGPVSSYGEELRRPPFPGFQAAFRVPWNDPILQLVVSLKDVEKSVYHADPHLRVKRTVDLFAEKILDAHREEETGRADFWFVVLPGIVKKYCRPKSRVEANLRISVPVSARDKRSGQMSLLSDEANEAFDAAQYEINFHHQLKARLLEKLIPTQIVLEETLQVMDATYDNDPGAAIRQSEIAWNLATAAFYKSGGRPWKVADVRPGVCYIGLVFKRDDRGSDPRAACCGAQMFLDSGDGAVFKGNVGPWYTPKFGDFHLNGTSATELIQKALYAAE